MDNSASYQLQPADSQFGNAAPASIESPSASQSSADNPSPQPPSSRSAREYRRPSAPLAGLRLQDPAELSHHARRCTVCSHPDRESIEQAFLHWQSPLNIAGDFGLSGTHAIYRHAHAFGLFQRRRINLRSSLEYVIENLQRAEPSAMAGVRAVCAYTRIDDSGKWINLPSGLFASAQTSTASGRSAARRQGFGTGNSNRNARTNQNLPK